MALFKRKETWWIDFYYQGKRYRQKIGTKKKDAEEALSRVKVKIAAGDFVPAEEREPEEATRPPPILFETFGLEQFLPWSKMQHSANHHNQQRMILSAHLVPCFKATHLHEITAKQIEDYRSKRVRRVNRATVNRELSCLRKLFRKAVEWGMTVENPALGIRAFKETPQSPRLLEIDEVARLLEACRQEHSPVDLYALICCIVFAGLRKAEVLNLRWDGID